MILNPSAKIKDVRLAQELKSWDSKWWKRLSPISSEFKNTKDYTAKENKR